MTSERFGALTYQNPIEFIGGAIRPLDDIATTIDVLREDANADGYLYPPTEARFAEIRRGGQLEDEEVPRTRRPAFLHFLPVTHEVHIDAPVDADHKRGDAGFLIHLAAYLFGTRLQFEEWRIDGRVPIERSTHGVFVTPRRANAFFNTSYGAWRSWSSEQRKAFINVLYVHSKASGYEWIWEQFLIEYMALDAFCNFAGLKNTGHAGRIEVLCNTYGLWCDAAVATAIVALRNDLVHEALWEGDAPGFRVSQHGWDCNTRLRALNQRLIPAALGLRSPYVTSNWSDNSQTRFFE